MANHIVHGPLPSGVLRFALPMAAAMTLHGAFNLVDAFFVGQLGDPVPLAAIGNCDPVLMISIIFGNGVSTASVAMIARAKGALDNAALRSAAGASLTAVALLSLLFGILGAIFARDIALAMGARGAVLDLSESYLRLMFAGSFTMMFLLQLTAIQRGAGDARGPTLVLIVANVLNVVAGPFLIFGLAGLPRMGLMGSAWATIGARGVGCMLALWLCLRERSALLPTGRKWIPKRVVLARIVRMALPNTLQLLVRVCSLIFLIAIVNRAFTTEADQSATAAFGIGIRIDMCALFAAMGFGAAAATYAGQNLGAGNSKRAGKAVWLSAGIAAAVIGLFSTAVYLNPEFCIRLFCQDGDEVARIGTEYLQYVSPTYVFASIAVVIALGLNGAGSMIVPAVIDVLVYGLLIVPVAYVLVFFRDYDRSAVWIAIACGNIVMAMAYATWFRLGRWKNIVI